MNLAAFLWQTFPLRAVAVTMCCQNHPLARSWCSFWGAHQRGAPQKYPNHLNTFTGNRAIRFVLASGRNRRRKTLQNNFMGGKWHNVAKIEAVKSLCSFISLTDSHYWTDVAKKNWRWSISEQDRKVISVINHIRCFGLFCWHICENWYLICGSWPETRILKKYSIIFGVHCTVKHCTTLYSREVISRPGL